jgi:S1/P1 Nuclease
MRLRQSLLCCWLCILLASSQAFAWGPDGHHTVGAIADRLIAGSHAATEIKKILGGLSLQDASVWADCAKGIDPRKNYTYQTEGQYPECKIYETPALEAEMSDFVRRNDKNCVPKPGEESCHKQYHYTDVAIQHDHYDRNFVGTRDDDIVAAISAATHVLKGDPAPAPFSFKNKREALLVLTHYVGDIHQPLHVGAVFLDTKGKRVNPDAGTFDQNTSTRGGNEITVIGGKHNLHALWDGIPASLTVSHVNAALIKQAEAIPATNGQLFDWSTHWADDTLGVARQAFKGLKFSIQQNGHWSTTLPTTYRKRMYDIKKKQLVKAGAHLAQLLQTIWQ